MHIVVFTKSTPDTAAPANVDAAGQVDWGDNLVINPWDEYAITEALLIKGEHGGQVTVITVGPEQHADALKHGLAVGCDHAIRIWDDALAGHDSLVYARAAAAAVNKLGDVDMVIFGKEFSDMATDQHIFQTARKLGWTALGFVAQIEAIDPGAGTILVQRLTEQGTQLATGALPAVISVLKDINEPKYPTFIGIRKAGKANIPVWDAAELGLDAAAVQSAAQHLRYQPLPQREGEVELIEGASVQDQAAKLVDRLIEEKVL